MLFRTEPDYQTWLNPANLYAFYTAYDVQEYEAIKKRFLITENEQVDELMGYFKSLNTQYMALEGYGGNIQYNSYAQLFRAPIVKAQEMLEVFLPFQLASRWVAGTLKNSKETCFTLVNKALNNTRNSTKACDKIDLSKLEDVQTFM